VLAERLFREGVVEEIDGKLKYWFRAGWRGGVGRRAEAGKTRRTLAARARRRSRPQSGLASMLDSSRPL